VRLANRQRGSGTRALLEYFIAAAGLDRARIQGYESEEVTHGAVAALIAGQQADVAIGVQAAAAQYRLGFVPLCTERYFLACHAEALDRPGTRGLVAMLRGEEFAHMVEGLPGYSAEGAGRILDSFDAPSWNAHG
jgi:molybdate-binding protein